VDAALINAAEAAEQGIARYGSPIARAKQPGRNDCGSILQKTLDEERATDKKLTTLTERRSIFARRADPSDASPVETKRRAGNAGATRCTGAITGSNVKPL